MGVRSIYDIDVETLDQYTQEMLRLKMVHPFVEKVRDDGSVDLNTQVAPFGFWLIKSARKEVA